jgi:hypothetical protein
VSAMANGPLGVVNSMKPLPGMEAMMAAPQQ